MALNERDLQAWGIVGTVDALLICYRVYIDVHREDPPLPWLIEDSIQGCAAAVARLKEMDAEQEAAIVARLSVSDSAVPE